MGLEALLSAVRRHRPSCRERLGRTHAQLQRAVMPFAVVFLPQAQSTSYPVDCACARFRHSRRALARQLAGGARFVATELSRERTGSETHPRDVPLTRI